MTKFEFIAGMAAAAVFSTGAAAFISPDPELSDAVYTVEMAASVSDRMPEVVNYTEVNGLSFSEKRLFDEVCGCGSDRHSDPKTNKNGYIMMFLESVRESRDLSLCGGCFPVDVPSSFSCSFSDNETFECVVGGIGRITAKEGFESNYKSIHVVNTYLENGQLVYKGASVCGDDPALSVYVDYNGSGKLVESKYFFCLYENENGLSDSDIAVVHLIERGFRDSELYKGVSK